VVFQKTAQQFFEKLQNIKIGLPWRNRIVEDIEVDACVLLAGDLQPAGQAAG
jgi:hypothetical protein